MTKLKIKQPKIFYYNVTILSINLIYFQNYFHQEALFLKCSFQVTDAFRTDFFANNFPDYVCPIQEGHVTAQKIKIKTKARKDQTDQSLRNLILCVTKRLEIVLIFNIRHL